MTEKEIYIEIAERFIQTCLLQLQNKINVQETIGFKVYHAFESIGGAVNCHLGHSIPWKHEKKINQFVINYKSNQFAAVQAKTIASLAIILNSLRNKFLYPEATPTGLISPKDQISLAQATQLAHQIDGIINRLSNAM